MSKVTQRDVLALASRAGLANQMNLSEDLFAMAGRMDRVPGGEGYASREEDRQSGFDEPDHIAAIRGRRRAERMGLGLEPAASSHHPREC